MGSKISFSPISAFIDDPLFYAKFYIWMGRFSKFPQILAKIDPNLRKREKKRLISVKIWPKIGPIGILMSHFFFRYWYLHGPNFKFPAAPPYQNQSWESPRPPPSCNGWCNLQMTWYCFDFRQYVFHHRQALCEQLKQASDPAMALHLTVVITFQNTTQCMLHAPGK